MHAFRWVATIALVLLLGATVASRALTVSSAPHGGAQCQDGIDNNANGVLDMLDPYCKLPGDNAETSFRSGVPGDDINAPASLDCWFDLNSGSGDDDCTIHACCMISGPCPADLGGASFNPNNCSISQACESNCEPEAKAGCDCFGCCQVCEPGTTNCATAFVNPVVSAQCTVAQIGNPAVCRACTMNPTCKVPAQLVFINGFE